uniref:Reverse transcriptase domain-containing protein n=1 Tax=Clastoptera arizonana TaxID=38151 RepID=A0A1B6E8D4_9HEMI
MLYTPADKVELFADSLQTQFTPHPISYTWEHTERVKSTLNTYLQQTVTPPLLTFSPDQVADTIHSLKPRKAPGLDKLSNSALKHLPINMLETITDLFNGIMRTSHFPAPWKRAKIILIKKPHKSALFPENFRPISLLPNLSKVFERLVYTHLLSHLHNTIRPSVTNTPPPFN